MKWVFSKKCILQKKCCDFIYFINEITKNKYYIGETLLQIADVKCRAPAVKDISSYLIKALFLFLISLW